MQLDSLPGGNLDHTRGMFTCHMVQAGPLRRGKESSGQPQADHIGKQPFEFFGGAFGAAIAVVLLVQSVELDKRLVIFIQGTGETVFQAFSQSTPQAVARGFYPFNR